MVTIRGIMGLIMGYISHYSYKLLTIIAAIR